MAERSQSPIEGRAPDNTSVREAAGWRCTTCGALIVRIEDGWVEWLAAEGKQGRGVLKGLRLVHRNPVEPERSRRLGCRYDFRQEFRNGKSIVEGLPLERFVGPDGLMLLLSFLATGEMPKDDLLELAKRVQIPGYEQTRELFKKAIEERIVAPAIRDRYYLQSEIGAMFRWARARANQPKIIKS